MKNLFAIAVGLAMSVSVWAGPYYTTNLSLGIDYVGASGNSNVAAGAGIQLQNNDVVGVHIAYRLTATDANSSVGTFNFWTAPDNYSTNRVTKHTIGLASNGTGWSHTNFEVYVGSMGYFGVTNISTTTTNIMTNPVVRLTIKEKRHGLYQ